jgi:hypothetical protein
MEITTTSWLIWELSNLESKKLSYRVQLQELEQELEQSELIQRINKWKHLLKQLEEKEIELKNNWIKILQDSWIDKFEANWVCVKLKTSLWRLIIEDEDIVPDEYKKVKTSYTIDKKELKKDIQEWVIIEWVSIEKTIDLDIKFI